MPVSNLRELVKARATEAAIELQKQLDLLHGEGVYKVRMIKRQVHIEKVRR